MNAQFFLSFPGVSLPGGIALDLRSVFARLAVAAFLAGEGVSRKIVEVPAATRELVDKLRKDVQALADRDQQDNASDEGQ